MPDFLDLSLIPPAELRTIIERAKQLKRERLAGRFDDTLRHRKLAMIFEKHSTRTRVSFEVGMLELGGHALYLSGKDTQIGRGETIADTAKALSRYVDIILLRCHSHSMLLELALHARVPVINGLTDFSHPCQIMADVMTFEERCGPIAGKTVAWVGDGNNVCHSFIAAAAQFGFTLRLACPASLSPQESVLNWARATGGNIVRCATPQEAVAAAQLVVTDTWVSMGGVGAEESKHMALLEPYQVNEALMRLAAPNALFMHCLPAHRGEEVTKEVIDGPQSVVWDEAENRLHVQKAILLWCMEK